MEANPDTLEAIAKKELPEDNVSKFRSKLMEKFKLADFPRPAQTVDSILALGKIELCKYSLSNIVFDNFYRL